MGAPGDQDEGDEAAEEGLGPSRDQPSSLACAEVALQGLGLQNKGSVALGCMSHSEQQAHTGGSARVGVWVGRPQ